MADEAKKEAQDMLSQASKPEAKGGMKMTVLIPMCLGVVLVTAAAAALTSKMMGPSKAEASGPAPASEEAPAAEPKAKEGGGHGGGEKKEEPKPSGEFVYYEFPPIVVNPNTPRLERYVRASIVLAFKDKDQKAAKDKIEEKKPELISWVTVYLSGLSLEDLRGPKNLNKIRREIQEAFNEHLFGDGRPLINHVLFKDFAIQ